MQKYEVLGVIGEGAYGIVLRCRNTENHSLVAIKKFKQTEDDQLVRKTTIREVKLLRMLAHPNIVELKEAFRKKGIVCLVFEHVQHNLLELLEKASALTTSSGLSSDLIRLLIYQLLKGIAYLHSQDIVHRDIKPENLLVNDKHHLKICDFGFARQLTRCDEPLTDYVATRWYRAPELLVGAKYAREVDIWAVGCIFGELVDALPMFPGQNQIDQLFLIQKCIGPLTSDHYETFLKNERFLGMKFPEITVLDTIEKRYIGKLNPKALSLLKCLLKMNPSERLTAMEALRHPYFDGMRDDQLTNIGITQVGAQVPGLQSPIQALIKAKQLGVTVEKTKESPRDQAFGDKCDRLDQFDRPEKSEKPLFECKTQYNRLQIRRKEEQTSRDSKLRNPYRHSKSLNKNRTALNKPKNKTISLQKHHNKDLIMKTQGGFFLQPAESIAEESDKYSRNKIYGVNANSKPKSRGSLPGELQMCVNVIFSNNTFNYKT